MTYRAGPSIGEQTLGPDHPDVAIWLRNLSEGLRDQGDLGEARQRYERALTVIEATRRSKLFGCND